MKRNKTAVIGLGNYLLADEGAGLHTLKLLAEKCQRDSISGVDLIEGGTLGMSILHQFAERRKIIFIDAGNCGIKPGDYSRFTPEDVLSRKKQPGISLHEFDLIGILAMAKKLNLASNIELVVYCIQAAEIKMSLQLSPAVQKSLPGLVQDIYQEVTSRGVKDA